LISRNRLQSKLGFNNPIFTCVPGQKKR
jgi:hypothetical protein